MDPISTGLLLAGGVASTAMSMGNKPGLPNIPPPPQPQQKPQPKPRAQRSMQDSFMTGVAGAPPQNMDAGKTLLGQ